MIMASQIVESLKVMGWGMLGIFVTIGIIIGIMYALSAIMKNIENRKNKTPDSAE